MADKNNHNPINEKSTDRDGKIPGDNNKPKVKGPQTNQKPAVQMPKTAKQPAAPQTEAQKNRTAANNRQRYRSQNQNTAMPSQNQKSDPSKQGHKSGVTTIPKAQTGHRFGAGEKTLRIIPLGGLEEIGKNMTVVEYGDDIVVIDCGLAFPDDNEIYGVDLVIPDITYLEKNADRIRGIVITHGHEDHIGSLPFVLRKLAVPVYGSRLAMGLVTGKLKEHGLMDRLSYLHPVNAGDVVTLGKISVEFIRVNHSIPDALAVAVTTPAGVVIHTGDFKIDATPIIGGMLDIARFSELGDNGVLLLMSDSTNAERPGFTMSERKVGQSFETIFSRAEKQRIVVASFASNIHRIQQVIDAAARSGRKVAVSGRSMINAVNVSVELGYLTVPDNTIIDLNDIDQYPKDKMVLITTGSQGEPMSALARMSIAEHKKVELGKGDIVIISATPIPGNEKTVSRVIDRLMKLGAEVVYEKMYEVHVSGHACQEELKLMLSVVKPQYFMPVHGEYRHLKKHADLARSMGMTDSHIIISEIGRVVEFGAKGVVMTETVPSGRILVDGLGIGDVGAAVLRERRLLSQDGLLAVSAAVDLIRGEIVSGPEITSRGFVYVKESEEIMQDARRVAKTALSNMLASGVTDYNMLKNGVKDELSKMIYAKIKRNPIIMPMILEV